MEALERWPFLADTFYQSLDVENIIYLRILYTLAVPSGLKVAIVRLSGGWTKVRIDSLQIIINLPTTYLQFFG